MRPQFEEGFDDWDAYREERVKALWPDYLDIIEAVQGEFPEETADDNSAYNHEDASYIAMALADENFSGVFRPNAKNGHAQFRRAYLEQSTCMSTGRYRQEGAQLIRHFSNLTSIAVCGGDGGLDDYNPDQLPLSHQPTHGPTFLQKRYPRVQLAPITDSVPGVDKNFLPTVLGLIQQARIKPVELVTMRNLLAGPAIISGEALRLWLNLPLITLKKLDLVLEPSNLLVWLEPTLQRVAETLEELGLGMPSQGFPRREHDMDPILTRKFTALRTLRIHGFTIPRSNIPHFLVQNPGLQRLRLERVAMAAHSWVQLFSIARVRPAFKVNITLGKMPDVRGKVTQWIFSAFGDIRFEDKNGSTHENELTRHVEAYIQRSGEWTTLLQERFGNVVDNI